MQRMKMLGMFKKQNSVKHIFIQPLNSLELFKKHSTAWQEAKESKQMTPENCQKSHNFSEEALRQTRLNSTGAYQMTDASSTVQAASFSD